MSRFLTVVAVGLSLAASLTACGTGRGVWRGEATPHLLFTAEGLDTARRTSRCDAWLGARRGWGAAAAGLGVVAGGGGLGAAFPENSSNRAYLGGASLAVGVASAVAAFLARSYADDFETAGCRIDVKQD